MRNSTSRTRALRLGIAVGVLGLLCAAWSTMVAQADSSSTDIVRVEEDWELVIGDPDPYCDAPQITSVMSPVGLVYLAYAAFDINHHSQPFYRAGGLQLQVWSNEVPLLSDNDPEVDVLHTSGESITWTQEMSLSGGVLTFAIVNGNSLTWGPFGGGTRLKAAVGTSLTNLNGYNTAVSVDNSGVGYAGNRVVSLVIKSVRLYSAQGLVSEDKTRRVVHELD